MYQTVWKRASPCTPSQGLWATALTRPPAQKDSAAPIHFSSSIIRNPTQSINARGSTREALTHPQHRISIDCRVALSPSESPPVGHYTRWIFSAHFKKRVLGNLKSRRWVFGKCPFLSRARAYLMGHFAIARHPVAESRIVCCIIYQFSEDAIAQFESATLANMFLFLPNGPCESALTRNAFQSDCTSRRLNPTFNPSHRLIGRCDRGPPSVGFWTATRTGYANAAVACLQQPSHITAMTLDGE